MSHVLVPNLGLDQSLPESASKDCGLNCIVRHSSNGTAEVHVKNNSDTIISTFQVQLLLSEYSETLSQLITSINVISYNIKMFKFHKSNTRRCRMPDIP